MSRTESIVDWFSERPTWGELMGLIGRLFTIKVAWFFVVLGVIIALDKLFGIRARDDTESPDVVLGYIKESPFRAYVMLFVLALGEEFVFRFIPFAILLAAIARCESAERFVVPTLIASSLAFGVVHVTNFDSVSVLALVQSIAIQGAAGILTGILFLKYTGLEARNVLGALGVTTITHYAWNVLVITPAFLKA